MAKKIFGPLGKAISERIARALSLDELPESVELEEPTQAKLVELPKGYEEIKPEDNYIN